VKFPSEPPPVDPSASSRPRFLATSFAASNNRTTADRASNGKSGVLQFGVQRKEGAFNTFGIRQCWDSHIDGRPCLIGDDVAARATADHPNVQTDAALRILHILEGNDLLGELVNGARAFARVDSGVRRYAAHQYFELPTALSRGLDRAAGQRRLEHEYGCALSGLRFDRLTRRPAANFLVRRPQHHNRREASPDVRERSHRRQCSGDPGLHVEHAGPVQAAVLLAKGHLLERADVPDGVEVPEDEQRTFAG
jgi:hypothetical protein